MNLARSIATFALGLATALPVVATTECQRLANEKRISKPARTGFVRKCVADRIGDPLARCEHAAAQRNLRGAERNASIKRCMVDASKNT